VKRLVNERQNGKTSHQPYAPKAATGDDDDEFSM
jgi:hypothetical protein